LKLLLDENLSPKLINKLRDLFSGLQHVRNVGLAQADDLAIWRWANTHGWTVVTSDSDFVALSDRLGAPPKIIHIERCDFPSDQIERLLRENAIRIAEFGLDQTAVLPLAWRRGK